MSDFYTVLNRAHAATIGFFVAVICSAMPSSARAVGVIADFLPFISLKTLPAIDSMGNPIFDNVAALDENGRPIRNSDGSVVINKVAKMETHLDPVGDAILKVGVDLTFDPKAFQVVTDMSSSSDPLAAPYGFLCNFSTNGNCPQPAGPNLAIGFGDALPGSTALFNVDNSAGRLTLSYDFSATPVSVTQDTNFFGFLFEPVVTGVVDGVYTLPPDTNPFTQHPDSSAQFCVMASTKDTGLQCSSVSSVPEPATGVLLGTGLTFVALFRRRLQAMSTAT